MDAQAAPAVRQGLGPGGFELLLIRFHFHVFTGSSGFLFRRLLLSDSRLAYEVMNVESLSVRETGSKLERAVTAVGLGADNGLELNGKRKLIKIYYNTENTCEKYIEKTSLW
jgi:hypothetical protein